MDLVSDTVPRLPGSALPPRSARILAFAAVVVAGICGGLIGWAVTDIMCDGGCPGMAALVGVIAAVAAAGGVAVVVVLTLRAMGEWRTTAERNARRERQGGPER